MLTEPEFYNSPSVNDPAQLKAQADLIIANRLTTALEDVKDKVYTRYLFGDVSFYRLRYHAHPLKVDQQ